jgi:outer membrane protein assembly factor BamB
MNSTVLGLRHLPQILLFLFLTTGSGSAASWPQFRGPGGLGHTDEKNLPLTWSLTNKENIAWTAPLVGQGHASPVVWENFVFLSTAHWPSNVTDREKVIPEHHVLCYRVDDGKMLWDTIVPPGPWLRTDFRSGAGGGYAGPTPVTDGQLVYCAFGSSVLAALDYQGKIVWRKEVVPYTFDVTLGSSPILYGNTVILLCAMAKASDSSVIAFDKKSGAVVWQEKMPGMGFGHTTPLVVSVQGRDQLLVLASGMGVKTNALRSLDPTSGKLLWWCRGAGDAASPAYGEGLIYFDSGRGGPGFCVDSTGSGDVSKTHVRWTVNQVPEGIGSPLIVGPHVYRLHTPGILKCWDLATGKTVYSERLEGLSTTWASPISDGNGRIYYANAGKSYVLQSGPEFRVLAVNDLGESNHPSPAVARDKLIVVGMNNVYALGLK